MFSTASGRRGDQFDRKRNFCLEVSYGEFHTRFQFLLFSLLTPDTRNLKPNPPKQKVETKKGKSNKKCKLSNEGCRILIIEFFQSSIINPLVEFHTSTASGRRGEQLDRKRNLCLEVSYGEFHTKFQFLLFSPLTPDTRNLKPRNKKLKQKRENQTKSVN